MSAPELFVTVELTPAEAYQLGALAGRARPEYYAERILKEHLRQAALKELRRRRQKIARTK